MRRRLLLTFLTLLVLGGIAAWFEPTGVVRGYVNGEPFYHGRPASTWAKRLSDSNPKVPVEAREQLKEGGADTVAVLTAIARAPADGWHSAIARVTAVDLLSELGPAASEAVPALIAALNDPDRAVRARAAVALGSVGKDDPQVVTALAGKLSSDEAKFVAQSLVKCGVIAEPAIPGLSQLLKNGKPEERRAAAKALGAIATDACASPLIAALYDSDDYVREHSAESLGKIGPAAAPATDRLIEMLQDPFYRARRDAARTLGQIGGPAKKAIPALQSLAIDDPEEMVRNAAANAVKRLGG
jgi:HEAT repeat protein